MRKLRRWSIEVDGLCLSAEHLKLIPVFANDIVTLLLSHPSLPDAPAEGWITRSKSDSPTEGGHLRAGFQKACVTPFSSGLFCKPYPGSGIWLNARLSGEIVSPEVGWLVSDLCKGLYISYADQPVPNVSMP